MKKYLFVSLAVFSILLVFFSISAFAVGVPRGKSAAAGLIPDELKSMQIEDYFVESKGNSVGSIQNTTGHVVVVHKDTNSAYFAATGDAVYQQDVFYTLKDSRCRIKFSTEDIITMAENSKVVADEIVDDQVSKKKSSIISMLKGKAMFYVVRLFRYKTVSASVKTPTAVLGVRGTKFGVEVRKAGEKVAGLSDDSFIYLAQNEPGNFETVVYGFEGTVNVTSTVDGIMQTVGAGESLVLDNIGAGHVAPTDPNTANQFVRETEGGGGTGGTKGADAGAGEGGGGGGRAGSSGDGGTSEKRGETGKTGDTTDTSSEDVAHTLSAQSIGTEVAPGARVGYFSTLLTRFDGNNFHLADVYANSSRKDFDSGSVSGKSIVDPAGYMSVVRNGSDHETYVTRINTVAGGRYDSGDLGRTREMDNDEDTPGWPTDDTLGRNSYMEWGFRRMSRWVPGDSTPAFAVTDRAYYLDGLSTSDAAVAGMGGAYTYVGPAWGTYFDGDGGKDMTGAFTCGINMTDKTVTDFDMSVSGGGRSAFIGNASGSFFGSSGEFKISGGDWYLTNSLPLNIVTGGVIQSGASALCTGSLFGPNAEHMGGVWAMDKGSGDNAAVGIFTGDKGGAPTTSAAPPVIPSPPTPPPVTPTGPTDKMGYFTAMLTYYDGYEYVNNGMFVSYTKQDLINWTNVEAHEIIYGDYLMHMDGLTKNNGKLASVDYGGGMGIIGGPYPVSRTVLGHNAHIEWGYWTQTDAMPDTYGYDNWVNNRGYYIAGNGTPDISALNQTWTYSGGAEGTYWTANSGLPGGGINMIGSFNATVDFSVPGITDFDMSVAGGVHRVSITGATSSFGGPEFSLSGGTWQIDNLEATLTAGYGSLYGPKAEAIGGVWGVKEHGGDLAQYATGIFHGVKHDEPIPPDVPSPPPVAPTGPTDKMGYFTAMLTSYDGYKYVNNGMFVSHYMQDIENGTDLIADDIVYGHEMHIDGSEGKLTSVVYSSESGGITGSYPVTRTLIGQNAYMEWGYWTQTTATYTAMPDTSDNDNWVNNRGYYIAGDYTPDISALNQVWTYSGGAEGTYWTANDGLPGGGINMTGSFNATVNFGFTSGQITDFDLTVSGGGNNVTISNATGSFDGGGSSQFTLDVGQDTAKLNTAPVSLGEGYGSVYGPNAEAIGGVWGVKEHGSAVPQYATGIFHGTR